MDDFEKDYPGFDWRNTPGDEHPGGLRCPCPRHEHLRELMIHTRQARDSGHAAVPSLRFCPEHYKVCMEEVIPALPLRKRWTLKFAMRLGIVRFIELDHIKSDLCFYCRFGSGGHGKRHEITAAP